MCGRVGISDWETGTRLGGVYMYSEGGVGGVYGEWICWRVVWSVWEIG